MDAFSTDSIMVKLRFSVRGMAFLILLTAVDCAWVPNIWRMKSAFGFGQRGGWHVMDLPVLGMSNLLAVAFYTLISSKRHRPFVLGFLLSGLALVIGYVILVQNQGPIRRHGKSYMLEAQYRFTAVLPMSDSHINEPGYIWRYVALDFYLMIVGTLPLALTSAVIGWFFKVTSPIVNRNAERGNDRPEPPPPS